MIIIYRSIKKTQKILQTLKTRFGVGDILWWWRWVVERFDGGGVSMVLDESIFRVWLKRKREGYGCG